MYLADKRRKKELLEKLTKLREDSPMSINKDSSDKSLSNSIEKVLPSFMTGKPIWFVLFLKVMVFICSGAEISFTSWENTVKENSKDEITDINDLNM